MLQIDHKIKEDTQDFINYKNEIYYPLSILIIYDNKFYKEIPSRLSEYLKFYQSNILRFFEGDIELKNIVLAGYTKKNFFEKILNEKIYPFYNLLEDEKNIIRKIFYLRNNNILNLSESEIYKLYIKYTTDISEIFDREISLKYQQELREIFTDVINKEHEKRIFAITDFLLHFINWNASFYYFYDSASEIIPGIIHSLEPYLSNELRITIRAYRVYFTQINIIKKILDKREKGKIINITYIDWEEEVKNFLFRSMTNIFGERVTNEYLSSLDKILVEYLK